MLVLMFFLLLAVPAASLVEVPRMERAVVEVAYDRHFRRNRFE
jgi:hypothetical protein